MTESREKLGPKFDGAIREVNELREKLAMAESKLTLLIQDLRDEWEKKVQETVPESVREQVWKVFADDLGVPIATYGRQRNFVANSHDTSAQVYKNRQAVIPQQHSAGQKKAPAARLNILVAEGLLTNGQTLFFRCDDGRPCPGRRYQAHISGNRLIHAESRGSYSMSRLARELNQDFGRQDAETRGPKYWYTEGGRSILDIWEQYLGGKAE